MQLNQFVTKTEFPPIVEAASWVRGRTFADDKPLIDVSQAVPGYPTSTAILEHMATVLKDSATSKYGDVLGLPELREAYAASLDCAQTISAENVAITAGCNQAFYVAIAALCAPGDEVVLPAPWYFNHKMSLDMLGINAIPLVCAAENQLIPQPEQALELINSRTRAIVLITPNNPTGQEYPAETIDAFYHLCQAKGIALIIDETYRDFRQHPDTPPHHIFDNADWFETAIHLYSFSKSYALAGYRVGALAASTAVNREVNKILDCVSICASQLSQQAALFGLQHASEWKEEKRQLMYLRAQAFQNAMSNADHGYEIAAAGAYFAYVRHPFNNRPAREVARHLAENANILALPGEMFGDGQQDYLRFAFANVDSSVMTSISSRLAHHQYATANQ